MASPSWIRSIPVDLHLRARARARDMGLAGHWLSYAKYARSRLQTVPGEPALVDRRGTGGGAKRKGTPMAAYEGG